jgi:hypothetical protein
VVSMLLWCGGRRLLTRWMCLNSQTEPGSWLCSRLLLPTDRERRGVTIYCNSLCVCSHTLCRCVCVCVHTNPTPTRNTAQHKPDGHMSRSSQYGRSSSASRARFEDAFRVYHEVSQGGEGSLNLVRIGDLGGDLIGWRRSLSRTCNPTAPPPPEEAVAFILFSVINTGGGCGQDGQGLQAPRPLDL